MFELSDSTAYIIGAIQVCAMISYNFIGIRTAMKSYNENYIQNNRKYGSFTYYTAFSGNVKYPRYAFRFLVTLFLSFVIWGPFPISMFFSYSQDFLTSLSM